jgi:hypothetical protein
MKIATEAQRHSKKSPCFIRVIREIRGKKCFATIPIIYRERHQEIKRISLPKISAG